MRGAFTTLYRNLTPAVWQSTFRNGDRAVPVPQLLRRTYALSRRLRVPARTQRGVWTSRLCCGLIRRDIVQCNLGCAPWRMLSAYNNASGARALEHADAHACEAARASGAGGTSGAHDGGGAPLWEQPALRGAETRLLHPSKPQTWGNGAMRCDFCISSHGRERRSVLPHR